MTLRSPPPAESDLLCESCGYILNGLDSGQGNCPECGEPVSASVTAGHRKLAPIEHAWTSSTFWKTTRQVIVSKRKFFRELITRHESPSVRRFGAVHRVIAGVLFGIAGTIHGAWMAEEWYWVTDWTAQPLLALMVAGVVLTALTIASLFLVTRLAVWLTTTESKFWGMRLPIPVVTRAMDFHAANYLPVAIVAVLATAGYRLLLTTGGVTGLSGVPYLVVLCALVVAAAVYLFESYVIAMRRIRLANF